MGWRHDLTPFSRWADAAPFNNLGKLALALMMAAGLAACADHDPPAPANVQLQQPVTPDYKIGPLDTIQIFVWQSPEFSVTVPVRPDGRISTPLIEDLEATGKTPTQLARDIEEKLKVYVQDPLVTVIVSGFAGPFDQQVRVVGEALQPRAIPYRANMTMLDVMIEVGGLTEFASGNRAVLARGGTPVTRPPSTCGSTICCVTAISGPMSRCCRATS